MKLKIILSLSFALIGASAMAAEPPTKSALPGPPGLASCAPENPLSSTMIRLAALSGGDLTGCFVSGEKVRLRAGSKAIDQPGEYAYAITVSADPSGPFAVEDIAANLSIVREQWKNFEPLWQQSRPSYETKIREFVQQALPQAASQATLSIERPILISIEQLGEQSYAVVSVRQRRMSVAGDAFVSTAIDATALTLRDGELIRLSLVRELQIASDVERVRNAIAAWIQAVGSAKPAQ
jgi:hypothetical protein